MGELNIYAFADEASGQVDGQIAALRRNGLNGLEIRGVDGRSIADISLEKAREVRRKLDDAGLSVWSMGSPIGKISIDDENFEAHLDKLRHVLELADALDSKNLRLFSFYVPDDRKAESRGKVIDWMGRMLQAAEGSGIALCHENEKGIYGDLAPRCRDLLDVFPTLEGIFDPANFVQCGQDTLEAWSLLKGRIKYLHIKDALADGQVVPSGCGIGHVPEIVAGFRKLGGTAVTVEPHLSVFDGLKNLEQAGHQTRIEAFSYPSSDAAFDAACAALRKILES